MSPSELAAIHALAMSVPATWTAVDFRELLLTDGSFVVSKDGAGFALGRVILDEAELLTLAVKPEAQRHGIGRSCLSSFEKEAAQRGAVLFHLEVAETNTPALGLYRTAGWQEVGRRKAYYKGDAARIDAILMTKRLTAF